MAARHFVAVVSVLLDGSTNVQSKVYSRHIWGKILPPKKNILPQKHHGCNLGDVYCVEIASAVC